MKKALAVVSSHYVGIYLLAICEGYVLPDDEVEAQEELQKLGDAADAPGDALASFFDAEVELPPSVRKDLVIRFFLFMNIEGRWALFVMRLNVKYAC